MPFALSKPPAKVLGSAFAFLFITSTVITSTALAQRNFGPPPNYAQPNYGQPQGYAPPQNYGQTQQRYFSHGSARKDELDQQKQSFKQWWGDEFVTKLVDLPAEGKVPEFRVPYAGHDYPDRAGGTINSLFKYDQAFHRGRSLAVEFERMDVGAHRASGERDEPRVPRGLFGRMRGNPRGPATPTWYGHCNGWTAAAIRHAEPQRSVVRNGVTFTPADIKGLLAEIYMYADSEFLGGIDPSINPGVLHLVLANWLGRGSHPLGMETAVGEVVINFPIFNYKSVIKNRSPRENEVQTWITYTLNVNRELDKQPPKFHRQLYFHYVLNTDAEGLVSGGQYYGDSGQIDMLWTPLRPYAGGSEHNKRGNPHLDIKEVLAIWRDSVDEDLRKKWLNIDPTEEDRVLPEPTAVAATTEQPKAATTEQPAAGASEAESTTAAIAGGAGATAGETTARSGGTGAAATAEAGSAGEASSSSRENTGSSNP
jgi:hypothetical protein